MNYKGISVILVIAFSSLMIMLVPSTLANISYAQLPDSSTTSTPQPSSTLPDGAVTITSPTQDKSYSFSSYGKTSDIYRGDGIQGGVPIPKASSSSIQTTSNNNNNIASNYDDKTNGGNNLTGNDKVVMINFDDGYKSHFLYAKPILDKYGFKATFFIVCGKMETNPKWMTWQDITALKDDGMDIQSHTMTHAHLDSVSAEKLDYETGYAKQCLADHGFDATIFAYPKNLGSDNNTVVNVVSKYYDLARSGTEPLFFLDCTGYKRYPQTDCSTDSADGSLNYANRYDIKNASPYHFSGNINLDESQMFDKFVQLVNRQTAFNSNGSINAIPIISYHNLTNNMQDYNNMATTLTVSLFDKEMKYLHDNGFKVLLLNQLRYDTKHNAFYLKNSADDDDNTAATTTTALRASTITTVLEKSTSAN
jgi:hypothetical protein